MPVKKNTKIELSSESFTLSTTLDRFRFYNRQKQRHFSASGKYRFWHKIILMLEPLTRLLFYASLLHFIVYQVYLIIGLPLFIIRLGLFIFVIYKASKRFNESGLIIFAILFDLLLPLLNFINFITSRFRRKSMTWN